MHFIAFAMRQYAISRAKSSSWHMSYRATRGLSIRMATHEHPDAKVDKNVHPMQTQQGSASYCHSVGCRLSIHLMRDCWPTSPIAWLPLPLDMRQQVYAMARSSPHERRSSADCRLHACQNVGESIWGT